MYHVVTIQNETTPAIFSYETFEAALAYYHAELAYRHESRKSTKCAILDSNLKMLRNESYIAPTPEPNEPEEVEEPEESEGE